MKRILLLATLLPAACGQVTPYSFKAPVAVTNCLMAVNPGNGDVTKPYADPWWFGTDGGIGGSDGGVQVPYLHVTTLYYGCLLKQPTQMAMEIDGAP